MDILFSASILAAFLAGMVALFAPCCIGVLLPAYLASSLRQKRNILRMTLIFFVGISTILIPIGLGAAALAQFFRDFHRELYLVGGGLMIVLAGLSVAGKGIALLPMPKRAKLNLRGNDAKSVFLLGLFAGAATSCCAPVLLGAVTLAAISGSFIGALVVTFAYIFGMTFPLFVAAYFYDRFQLEKTRLVRGKLFKIGVGARAIVVHSTNLLAGIIFLVMGIILFVLGLSGNAFWSPSFQVKVGNLLNLWSQKILEEMGTVPDLILAIVLVGIFWWLWLKSKRGSPDD